MKRYGTRARTVRRPTGVRFGTPRGSAVAAELRVDLLHRGVHLPGGVAALTDVGKGLAEEILVLPVGRRPRPRDRGVDHFPVEELIGHGLERLRERLEGRLPHRQAV